MSTVPSRRRKTPPNGLPPPATSIIARSSISSSTPSSSPRPTTGTSAWPSDALAAGKDVYLEKPVTHTLEEGATLTRAVRSGKQILQCGMQQRSWSHFRDAVDLIQGGSLGRIPQVRTYWWQNYLAYTSQPFKPSTCRPSIGSSGKAALRAAIQRRKILSLALVLELWRWRHDRSVHPLDRRRALGHEIRSAHLRANPRR